MTNPFRRPTEADAYRVLHGGGLAALEARYGIGIADDLINHWHEIGIAKIRHLSVPTGRINPRTGRERMDYRMDIKTYAKYAKLT